MHARPPCSTRHGIRCASPHGSQQTAVCVGVREARTNRTPRPKCGCDPCRDVRRALHGRPGYSYVPGSRASWHAGGCSAGRCASWCSSLRLGVLGRRALGTYTTGRTDLFLGTKVRNVPISGQTRAGGRSRRSPRRTNSGTRWAGTEAVVRVTPNLWKTLAPHLGTGIGSPTVASRRRPGRHTAQRTQRRKRFSARG